MPVVRLPHYKRIVLRNHSQAKAKLWDEAKRVLAHDKIRASLEGWANKVLSRMMANGINAAIGKGSKTVDFSFDTSRYGRQLWNKFPPDLRKQLPLDLLVLAFELILHEAGFTVSVADHACTFSMPLPEDAPPAETAEPVVTDATTAEPASLEDALARAGDLSSEEGDDGGDDLDADPPAAEPPAADPFA